MSTWESAPLQLNDNTRKFLDFLSKAEGADYNTITGGKRFNDFSQHPDVVGMVTKQGPSTAAGRYQITKSTYDDIAPKLGITDFSPESQDRIALELIKRNGALQYVQDGDYQNAIKRLGGTWASLPSSIYAGHPHRSQGWVEKTLNTLIPSAQATSMANTKQSDAGWESAPAPKAAPTPVATDDGWETAPAAKPKATLPDIEVPTAQAQPAPQPKSALKRVDDFVRGAADALTFGYADEIAGKLDNLFGINTSGKGVAVPKTYDEAVKLQRQRDAEGGPERVAGQLSTVLLPTLGAVRAAEGATRAARAGAGAATGAIQGALYGSGSADGDINDRLKGAATGATVGAVGGGILGGVLPATVTQTGNSIIKKAGDEASAKMDAEIIRDLNKVAGNPNNRGNVVQAVQANALETKYINDAQNAIKELGKDGLKKLGADPADLNAALQSRRIITPDELDALRNTKAGEALADAIEKAQRTRSLTAPIPAADNILARTGRAALDLAPIPQPLRYVGQRALGARQTREDVINKLISDKQAAAAEDVLSRLGPSAATQSLDDLTTLAQKAQAAAQARAQQQQAAQAQALAQQAINRNQILQQTRMPSGGAFQELLGGGRSGLNMASGDAIDALRTVSKMSKDTPVGEAAQAILKSQPVKDEQAFYGVQNLIRRLSEEGKIPQGSVTVQGISNSGIRNPASYAANVKNASEALKVAVDNAPSPAMAQFASAVGRIKSSADKAKAIEDRLAKATDPAEVDYLTNLVKPLANFGKK